VASHRPSWPSARNDPISGSPSATVAAELTVVAQREYSQYGVHVGYTAAWRREYGNGRWSPGADVAAAHLARRKTASRRPANKTTWAKDKQTSTQTNEQTRKQTRKQTPRPNDHGAALRAFGSAEFSEGCDAEHCPP
jgi:hypothetical protein